MSVIQCPRVWHSMLVAGVPPRGDEPANHDAERWLTGQKRGRHY